MNEAKFLEILANILVQFPLAGIALWLFYREREHAKIREQQYYENQKAETRMVLEAFTKNAEAIQAIENALDNNNKILERLCTKIGTLSSKVRSHKDE